MDIITAVRAIASITVISIATVINATIGPRVETAVEIVEEGHTVVAVAITLDQDRMIRILGPGAEQGRVPRIEAADVIRLFQKIRLLVNRTRLVVNIEHQASRVGIGQLHGLLLTARRLNRVDPITISGTRADRIDIIVIIMVITGATTVADILNETAAITTVGIKSGSRITRAVERRTDQVLRSPARSIREIKHQTRRRTTQTRIDIRNTGITATIVIITGLTETADRLITATE
jgi:hypothetical protein